MYRILCWAILFASNVCCDSSLLRQTIYGPIEGVERTSILGQKYYAFEGIPYAEPPITGIDPYTGKEVDRRFKAPEPLKRKWSKPIKAHHLGNLCMPGEVVPSKMFATEIKIYPKNLSLTVSEDCLFLNVYVPVNGAARKTVLTHLHGGGYGGGVSVNWRTGPDFLLSLDNIVVKIGYRVEKYGFLNLGYGEYTGNMALKDQQMALRWIHENIENFSGKKDEVLLFGGSTGGGYVHYHMLNEQSRKYFKRAFSSSGTVLSLYALRRADYVEMMQNCFKIYDMDRLIDALKTASAADLVNCTTPSWYPTIESPNTRGAFLTKTPEEIYSSDSPPVMDALFGFASQEVLQAKMVSDPLIGRDWNETNLHLRYEGFSKEKNPKEYKLIVKKLRKAYFKNTTNLEAIRSENIALFSDLYMTNSVLKMAILQTNANNNGTIKSQHKNTFLYSKEMRRDGVLTVFNVLWTLRFEKKYSLNRYSFNTELNLLRTRRRYKNFQYAGAAHSDDLCYMFHCDWMSWYSNFYFKHIESKDIVYDQIMRLVAMITNFARTGDPSIEGDTPFKSCKSSDEIFCQELSNEPKTRITYDIKLQLHYDLWREIDEILALKNQTTGNMSNRLNNGYYLLKTLFIIHVFLYVFASVS